MTTHPDTTIPTTTRLDDAELAEAIATATTTRTLTAILRHTAAIAHAAMLAGLALGILAHVFRPLVPDLVWVAGSAAIVVLAALALTFAAGMLAAMLDDAPEPDDHDAVAAWWIVGTRAEAPRR